MKRIAIVGGGIAGLSAAYRAELLRREGKAEYILFEASDRLGGVIRTEMIDGCVVEAGPDSFLTEKPAAAALCHELGLGAELIGSNDEVRSTAIVVDGRLVPLPDGMMFMVPTRVLPLLTSPLFSSSAKLGFAREWLRGPLRPAPAGDESVAAFVRRHFAKEVVERLADPLLSGIYGGDAERLSARSVLPRMVAIEQRHGSLTRGLLASRRQVHGRAASAALPLFSTLRGGLQILVEALRSQLDFASLRLGERVRNVTKQAEGWAVVTDRGAFVCDGVVLALPAYAAAGTLERDAPALARELAAVPYTSSITVAFAYDASAAPELHGFGFLVPRTENRLMLACTYVHQKFAERAPAARALLRCFVGGEQAERALTMDDGELVEQLGSELSQLVGLSAAPLWTRVFRWPRAMAQYEVGHGERLERIQGLLADALGLALAGNAYHGIGIPDCIAAGANAIAALTK